MSVFGVILVRFHSECRKIRTRIATNTDTFYAVMTVLLFKQFYILYIQHLKRPNFFNYKVEPIVTL